MGITDDFFVEAERIDRLIERLSQAKNLHAEGRKAGERGDAAISPAGRVLSYARGVCRNSTDIDVHLSRSISLLKRFAELFPQCDEAYLLRAPGRVNLIGEHTDYNGLPVLPIAINRDIMVACAARNDAGVFIHNVDPCFESCRFEISGVIEPSALGDWGNYAKAAVQALEQVPSDSPAGLKGFNALVDGNIPIASGLSSSSALVVAFALAALSANGCRADRAELAELLAGGEHYVGTRGGGMDQAICLLAEEGKALKIDFFPMHTEAIALPLGHSFVVCDSLVAAPKTSIARFAYNLRAAESRVAAELLKAALVRERGAQGIKISRLGDLCASEIGLSDAEIDSLVERTLTKDEYGIGEASGLLNMDERDLRMTCFDAFGEKDFASIGSLKLRSRCRHVLSEGRRVERAAGALRNGDMAGFGALMNASHGSCAIDYEISIPELDALVSIARDAGALGSRLTGAGFGGCTVSLVRNCDIEGFREKVERRYYGEYLSAGTGFSPAARYSSERILVCTAARGAGSLFA